MFLDIRSFAPPGFGVIPSRVRKKALVPECGGPDTPSDRLQPRIWIVERTVSTTRSSDDRPGGPLRDAIDRVC